ncbi:MAG: NUDIX domain-containing protein [Treponema sp.]|jgi:ADP-ribose pyrophosphatase YjhB (NUDIX family)|nr:NUDIX domain-containing protein [Treponema sp.]
MGIRSTAKAIIMKNGKILLNKCIDKKNGNYYSLPGGGQHQYETLHEALIRECLEETGYTIIPIKFVALCEEICMDEKFRKKYPYYAHKMYHIFICELTNEEIKIPIEKDSSQVSSEWIEINTIESIKILPKLLSENIRNIIDDTTPLFLGSEHIDFNHG